MDDKDLEKVLEQIKNLNTAITKLDRELLTLRLEHDTAIEKQNEISTLIGRIVTVVFTAIAAGFMAWLIKGGLYNGPRE